MSSPTKPSAASAKENVKVVVRCRPLNHDERSRGVPEQVFCDTEQNEVKVHIALGSKVGEKVFPFDRVYDTMATQREIYHETVEPMVQQTLRGYNTTVFAYGQTGTGKTFTMEGDVDDPERMGVIPRAVASIFRTLEARGEANESFVKASYLEIYNENCTDLLAADAGECDERTVLRVVEDKTRVGRGVIVHGLQEVLVKSVADIQRVMKQAISRRKTAATDLNEQSSRSHAIFTVTVHIRETNEAGEEMLKVGKINLVDLAGSESAARSGSKDVRAREAGNINQSLLTLGRVITALVEKSPHVPYRDSKLTRLLQESLGGCALTCILATVAPSVQCLDETLSTLEYASRAKSIRNKPMANQKMTKKLLIKEYVEELERLRVELQAARAKEGVYLPEAQYNSMVLQLKGTSTQVVDMEQALEKRAAEVAELKQNLAQTTSELNQITQSWHAAQTQLANTAALLEAERRLSEERQVVIEAHVNTESRLLDVHDALQSTLQVAAERIEVLQDRIDNDVRVCAYNGKVVNAHQSDLTTRLSALEATTSEAHRVSDEAFSLIDQSLERMEKLVGGEWQQERTAHRQRIVTVGMGHLDRLAAQANEEAKRDAAKLEAEFTWANTVFDQADAGVEELAAKAESCSLAWERVKQAETDAQRERVMNPMLGEVRRCRQSLVDMRAKTDLALGTLALSARQVAAQSARDVAEAELSATTMMDDARQHMDLAAATAVERISAIVSALAATGMDKMDSMKQQAQALTLAAHEARQAQLTRMAGDADSLAGTVNTWTESEALSLDRSLEVAAAEDAFARDLGVDTEAREALAEALASASRQRGGIEQARMHASALRDKALATLQARQQSLQDAQRVAHQDVQGASFSARDNDARTDAYAVEVLQDNRRRALSAAVFGRDQAALVSGGLGEASQQVRGLSLRDIEKTGRTPSRSQALRWTKERPTTSPHEQLLARYRRARGDGQVAVEGSTPPGSPPGEENIRPSATVGGANVAGGLPFGLAGGKEVNLQELRTALKERGLSIVGTKAQLLQRLESA